MCGASLLVSWTWLASEDELGADVSPPLADSFYHRDHLALVKNVDDQAKPQDGDDSVIYVSKAWYNGESSICSASTRSAHADGVGRRLEEDQPSHAYLGNDERPCS